MASNRSVVVRIKAEYAAFKRDMDQVSKAAEDAAKKTEQSGERASSALGRLTQDASKNREAWDTAGNAATGFGLAAIGAVTLAISKYASFEKAMSNVQAATHESAANMELLRGAALTAGADTAYSAEEAAGAIEELAKAGVSTSDILNGGLNGALALAAAGEMDVAQAAETAASAMTQFKLAGSDIPHIADLLAAGAGKAQGSVEDMGAALNQAGLVAAGTGLNIEETTGTLAAFASAGLIGSDAGTAFKTMLQRLNPQSEAAASKMAELGISAYDAQGNFIGMEALAGKLQKGMSGLSEEARATAMNVIFGSDAVRAANVLFEQGADGIAKWTDAVDSSGFAAMTASIKQDNLLGDLEKLGGAFDTVFLKSGGSANESLRGLVQTVEGFVDGIGKLPVPVLETGLALTGIAGSTALAIGGVLKLTPAVLDGVSAFRNLGTEGGKVPGTLGKIAKGAGIAAIAIGAIATAGQIFTTKNTKSAEEFGNAILKVAEAGAQAKSADLDSIFSGDWDSSFGQKSVQVDNMADAIARLSNTEFGDGINQWADQFFSWTGLAQSETTQVKNRLADLGDEMGNLVSNGGAEAAADAFNLLAKEFEANGKSAQDALNTMPGYKDALDALGQSAGVALTDTELLQLATGKIPDVMVEAQEKTALAEAQFGTYKDAVGDSVPVTEEQAKALEDVGLAADGTVVALDKYVEALFAAGLSEMSAREATAAHQEALRENAGAIDAAREALAKQYEMEGMSAESAKALADAQDVLGIALNENKTDFDLTSAAGAALNAQFQNVATTGMAEVEAKAKAGVGQPELQANLATTFQSLLTTLDGMGITGTAADDLARKVMGIPPEANVDTWMSDQAKIMAEATIGTVNALDGRVANVYTNYHETTYRQIVDMRARSIDTSASDRGYSQGGGVGGLASGGRLPTTGPGTDRTDGILGVDQTSGAPISWLDGGEWVINERSSDKYDRLLYAINQDNLSLAGLPGFAGGGRMSGRIDGLGARPGEANSVWQARQLEVIKGMESIVGELADWEIHEDGSGWVRTMDNTMVHISDGVWTATKGINQAGVSANATAGTFRLAGQVTKQAARAILEATAAVNSAGKRQAPAKGGGLTAQAGEANAVWRGRQDQFEQALSKQFGGIKYSDIHEDGSGQIVLDDGRLVELNQGRWRFVSKFTYGAPARGRTLSKYAGGGRLPSFGPGTEREDGFLGLSSSTGAPSFYADGGEWIVNSKSSEKHHSLISMVNDDDPRLGHLYGMSNRGIGSRGHASTVRVDASGIEAAVARAMSGWRPVVDINGQKFHGLMNRTIAENGPLPAAR
ncbi:phage tail tape measure protein [Arthrobacter sp. D2-10]